MLGFVAGRGDVGAEAEAAEIVERGVSCGMDHRLQNRLQPFEHRKPRRLAKWHQTHRSRDQICREIVQIRGGNIVRRNAGYPRQRTDGHWIRQITTSLGQRRQ